MLWYVFALVLTIFLYIKLITPYSHWEKRKIKHKKGWPLIGNMGPAVFRKRTVMELIKDLYEESNQRYFGVYQFSTPILMIKDLELIKRITIKDFDSFINHNLYIPEKSNPLIGNNLFFLKDTKWRSMRQTFSPAFTGSKMRSMYVLMSDCAQKYIKSLQEQTRSDQILEINIGDVYSKYAIDAVATCAFGLECNSLEDENNQFYQTGYMFSVRLMDFFNIKFLDDETTGFYEGIVKETMKKREELGIYRPDMINLMMEARKGRLKFEESQQDDDVGFATVNESDIMKHSIRNEELLTDDVLTAQAMVFFLAGFDTIVQNMKVLSYELATNPDIQQKLQNEIDQTFEEHNIITYDVIKKMKYLDMVVSELLRKYPGPFTDRICTKPFTIKSVSSDETDIHLKPGDCIWIPVYGIHHDPKYYPDPDRFDPERFSEENKKNINPYAYLPFGIGPRSCIGNRFALMEIKSFFVYLLKDFDILVTEKTEIPLKISKLAFGLHTSAVHLGLKLR